MLDNYKESSGICFQAIDSFNDEPEDSPIDIVLEDLKLKCGDTELKWDASLF